MLIAHTTDLTGHDALAFIHATGLAAAAGATLVTIHGNPRSGAVDLPDAVALAARWGRTVAQERRCHDCCEDVTDTVLDALLAVRPDLVVVGTHARHGFAALANASVGEAIARNVACPVLVVPNRSRGFVDASTGVVDLHRIVVPAGNRDEAQCGIDAARAFAAAARVEATLDVVHIDDRAGRKLEDAILDVAQDACLVVMPTRGHDGLGDVFLGSHTERVIRNASCPVLAVPLRH
jgi:nucleotide-binding universal stress UspA family protein